MTPDLLERYKFGPFEIDGVERALRRDGEPVPLAAKAFDLLLILVRGAGQTLTKPELMTALWPDTIVEESNLTQTIFVLRKVLGEDVEGCGYILTVPRRGYKFVAPVTEGSGFLAARKSSGLMFATVRRAAAAFIALGILGILCGWAMNIGGLRSKFSGRAANPPIRSIAVLPLRDLSDEPRQDYFSEAITDELISSLAQIHAIGVTSRTSAMHYKGSTKPLPEIGRELGVDGIVEGSVQRSGGRVRISAQLVRASTDKYLWAKEYERDLADVLKLEAEVARAIAREIEAQVSPEETERLTNIRPINSDAQEEYWLGNSELMNYDRPDLAFAIDHFERAIQIQPDYASAHAGLARAWRNRNVLGPGRSAAAKALELDANAWEAHEAMAEVHFSAWDWASAEKEFRRAIDLNRDAYSYGRYAIFLWSMGRLPEAISVAERTVEIDPFSSLAHENYGGVLYGARRFREAIPHLQRSIELNSRDKFAPIILAEIYEAAGRSDDAVAVLDRPGFQPSPELAQAYAASGRPGKATETVKAYERLGPPSDRVGLALAYFHLGDKDRGFDWLSKAFDARELSVPTVNFIPGFDIVRSDPRFKALVRRLRIPE